MPTSILNLIYREFLKSAAPGMASLALQLPFLKISESMGNHDSKIVDADSVD